MNLVSWKYGSGRPGGTVAEVVEEGQASVTSKKGNEIHRNAEPDNPAVKISRSGNDVVKKASELDIEDKGGDDAAEEEAAAEDDKKDDEEKAEENGDAQTGEKRKAEEEAEDEKAEEEPKAAAKGKKQKTGKAAAKATNGEKAAPKPKGTCVVRECSGMHDLVMSADYTPSIAHSDLDSPPLGPKQILTGT